MTKNILFEEDSASYETNTNRLGSQKKFFPHNNNNSYKGKKRHSWKITDISREKGFEFSPTERIWTQTSLRRNLFFSFGKNQQKKHKNIKTQEKSKKNIKSKIIQKKVFIKMHHQFIFIMEKIKRKIRQIIIMDFNITRIKFKIFWGSGQDHNRASIWQGTRVSTHAPPEH